MLETDMVCVADCCGFIYIRSILPYIHIRTLLTYLLTLSISLSVLYLCQSPISIQLFHEKINKLIRFQSLFYSLFPSAANVNIPFLCTIPFVALSHWLESNVKAYDITIYRFGNVELGKSG